MLPPAASVPSSEILLVEDELGFVELFEIACEGHGRRRRVRPMAGAIPPRGRARHQPSPAPVDEAAQTGVFLKISRFPGKPAGRWTPVPR
jgi:hypothetical protein